MDWPFEDEKNVAVFTSRHILDGEDWVYYVTHDVEDGAWQFHPNDGPTPENDTRIVGLEEMIEIEPRLAELSDLPLGWHAWRETKDHEWRREPKDQ